ncbi:MAG: DUF559 domain-containing protein [Acidobacteriota bacterium]
MAKIERNRQRDREVSRRLEALGWAVVRVWETDVRRDPGGAVAKIQSLLELRASEVRLVTPPRARGKFRH